VKRAFGEQASVRTGLSSRVGEKTPQRRARPAGTRSKIAAGAFGGGGPRGDRGVRHSSALIAGSYRITDGASSPAVQRDKLVHRPVDGRVGSCFAFDNDRAESVFSNPRNRGLVPATAVSATTDEARPDRFQDIGATDSINTRRLPSSRHGCTPTSSRQHRDQTGTASSRHITKIIHDFFRGNPGCVE